MVMTFFVIDDKILCIISSCYVANVPQWKERSMRHQNIGEFVGLSNTQPACICFGHQMCRMTLCVFFSKISSNTFDSVVFGWKPGSHSKFWNLHLKSSSQKVKQTKKHRGKDSVIHIAEGPLTGLSSLTLRSKNRLLFGLWPQQMAASIWGPLSCLEGPLVVSSFPKETFHRLSFS